MRIAAVMYLDHNDVIKYPLEHVIDSLPLDWQLYLFPSDETNFEAFVAATGGSAHVEPPLGIKIATVGDIPRMMNCCVGEVRSTDPGIDFIVLVQADTLATPDSIRAVEWFAQPHNLTRALHLNTQIAFLYHYSGGGWGHTVIGRKWRGYFGGDGIGYNEDKSYVAHLVDENRHDFGNLGLVNLEIGSLSVDLYYRHISQHVQTWNEAWLLGDRIAAYRRGQRDEFIRLSLRDLRKRIHNTRPLTAAEEIEPRYGPVIDVLGLRAEADRVLAIGREVEQESR